MGLSLPLCKGAGQLRWSPRSPLPDVKPSFGVESIYSLNPRPCCSPSSLQFHTARSSVSTRPRGRRRLPRTQGPRPGLGEAQCRPGRVLQARAVGLSLPGQGFRVMGTQTLVYKRGWMGCRLQVGTTSETPGHPHPKRRSRAGNLRTQAQGRASLALVSRRDGTGLRIGV